MYIVYNPVTKMYFKSHNHDRIPNNWVEDIKDCQFYKSLKGAKNVAGWWRNNENLMLEIHTYEFKRVS